MLTAVLVLALQALFGGPAPAKPPFDHVILVSFDGLRPDGIDERADGPTPTLARMLRGPGTLNARTDSELTITLPNHMCMMTSRHAAGPDGHGWVENNDPPAIRHGGTLEKRNGKYIACMFDVAHDRGAATGVFVSKTKFSLLVNSYGEAEGAKDKVPPDNGRNKIDVFVYSPDAMVVAAQAVAWLQQPHTQSLAFVHFSDPDSAGHEFGWDMAADSPYRRAIANADKALRTIVAAVEGNAALRGRTAIIVTTDHGGGAPFKTHTESQAPINFRIPFLVWLGQDTPRTDLVALNKGTRAQIGQDDFVPQGASVQPLRNGDAGNLALSLLGLPPIDGSHLNAGQDLTWKAATPAEPR